MEYGLAKERDEAIAAGVKAQSSLQCALDELNRARNWGVVDMFSKGGFLTALIKHSKMENAQQYMDQAKRDVRLFRNELKDVQRICDLRVETGDFLTFADWFFDNFFVDWMVMDRINTARSQVEEAISQIDRVLRSLRGL